MNSKSLAASALITSVLAAQSNPPPIPIELRARFGFTGPLVQKIGYGINSLEVGDIDGDGKVEAITFDARRARIVAVSVDDGATSNVNLSVQEIPGLPGFSGSRGLLGRQAVAER